MRVLNSSCPWGWLVARTSKFTNGTRQRGADLALNLILSCDSPNLPRVASAWWRVLRPATDHATSKARPHHKRFAADIFVSLLETG